MFRTWLRRWLGVLEYPAHEPETRTNLAERVSQLEEHVDFLAGALRRLRGRVTGGLRSADPDGGDGGPVTDAPPGPIVGNPRAIELLKKRGRA